MFISFVKSTRGRLLGYYFELIWQNEVKSERQGLSVQDGILQAGGQNSEDIRRYTLYLKDIACLERLVNLISLLYKEI